MSSSGPGSRRPSAARASSSAASSGSEPIAPAAGAPRPAGTAGAPGATAERMPRLPLHARLGDLLRQLAQRRGSADALSYPGFVLGGSASRRSFAQLDTHVDRLARGLLALGLRRGDHVALWAANVPDWIPLEFALARVGAVLVTMNTALQRGEASYVLENCRPVAVIHTTRSGSNESSQTLDALLADTRRPTLRHRIWMASYPGEEPPPMRAPHKGTVTTLADLVSRGSSLPAGALAEREASLDADDVVNVQYTSGTTGFPKGVMLSHKNLLCSAWSLGDQLRLQPQDRVALVVPLFHCFGCVVAVLATYSYGASLHAIPAFQAEHALRLVHEERCTVLHGVPTMFSAMLNHPERSRFDTSCLRTGLMAGATCPPALMTAVRDTLGCTGICIAYGLTEAAPGVAGCHPEEPFADRSETIGRAILDVEVRIADPATGKEQPVGVQGEIRVRGRNTMQGYLGDSAATAAAITQDGWLCTGDLGLLGPDGLLRHVGRIKDIIIRGGENIAPAEIEIVLREHPDVLEAAVVGVPHDHFGEEVAAALVLRAGAELDEAAYERLLEGRIAAFKRPKVYRAFESFPLTGSGKVKKFLIAEQIAATLG